MLWLWINTLRHFGRRRCRSTGQPLRVGHKQEWGRGFILLLTQAIVLSGQMLAVLMLCSIEFRQQNFRPRAPCGARCTRETVRT